MIKYLLVTFMILFIATNTFTQSFGIRAGLNYTKFSGPLELGVGESYSLSNGFHFGVNYAYKLAEDFSIKGELLYTQIGTKYNYDGDSFYKVPLNSAFVYEKGRATIDMKISNAYISLPITVQWQASKKIELFAGGYISFLVGPKGNGTLYFEKNLDSLFFKQSLIHNYNSDLAGGIASSISGPSIWVDGIVVTLAKDAGAYYNYLANEKVGKLYKPIDFGLTGGVNYFINKGFYVGLRYDIGFTDVTNDKMDKLRKFYDEENNNSLPALHFDKNIGFEVSFGFRF